jgi:hypothetical protein
MRERRCSMLYLVRGQHEGSDLVQLEREGVFEIILLTVFR